MISSRNITERMNEDNLIQSFLMAIDKKNKKGIEALCNKNNKYDIKENTVYEMYIKNELNSERLQFIIENCISSMNISSFLIKQLMMDNNKELLEILFEKHLKFFDNKFILKLLKHYESKTSISDSELYPEIYNDKYKISTELDKTFDKYDSSVYLFNACKNGNEAAVKFLLEHGANMKMKDKDNRIALARACESGNLHLVKYLVQLGADINNENNLGDACSSGNLDLVKYLVEHGLNINKEENNGCIPLFNACENEHINVVKYLVEQGANINKENNDDITPLFYACKEGHLITVKYLVEQGADINKEDILG